jgi:hypothetical protein
MPVHDWTKADDGVFHDFHHEWISSLKHALNDGILPPDYYAMADQVAGPGNPDVLGLERTSDRRASPPPGGQRSPLISVAPRVQFHDQAEGRRAVRRRPKRVAVRHKTGDRVVALIEIVSRGNKSSRPGIRSFVEKLTAFVEDGIHLLVLDLFPPGPRDPQGIHPLIWSPFKKAAFELPPDRTLTLAAYAAGPVQEAFVQPVAVGEPLPDMPLFLTPDEHVPVPLEVTYQVAWSRVPARWREVLESATE